MPLVQEILQVALYISEVEEAENRLLPLRLTFNSHGVTFPLEKAHLYNPSLCSQWLPSYPLCSGVSPPKGHPLMSAFPSLLL